MKILKFKLKNQSKKIKKKKSLEVKSQKFLSNKDFKNQANLFIKLGQK